MFIFSVERTLCQKESVTQERATQTEHGETVTLECSYETNLNIYMLWYKQKPGQTLEYLARADYLGFQHTNEEYQNRASIKLHLTNRTCPFTLSGVLVEDSAVYYCALSPTVTLLKCNLFSC
uniref:Ig-like domain-containing protein n=1 Tax=Leptobrachium leishanense TaxID=445787 RepID=A0A8C5M8F1_9ANUR